MKQGVIAAFQQAANDDNKPAMIVIDTADATLGARLAAEIQSRPHGAAHGGVIVDMALESGAAADTQDAKILAYTREMSQAVALQQPIIALVNLAGLDDADRRVALTGIALGLNYDIRAYHVIPAAGDTDEPPAMAGGNTGDIGGLEFQHVAGGADIPAMAKLISDPPAKSGAPGAGKKPKAKKPGGKGMGK